MYNFRGLPYLKTGKWVKVKGKPANAGTFSALEVTVKSGREFIEIEGVIQAVDLPAGRLHIASICIPMRSDMPVHNNTGQEIAVTTLCEDDLIWVEGQYGDNGRFLPQSIVLRQRREFTLDTLQGSIEWVDRQTNRFGMFGLTIAMSAHTSVEVEHDLHDHD